MSNGMILASKETAVLSVLKDRHPSKYLDALMSRDCRTPRDLKDTWIMIHDYILGIKKEDSPLGIIAF